MTAKVLEAMMCVLMWHDRDDLCRNRVGCKGCPYDLRDKEKPNNQPKICDKASTEFVLDRAAKAFREYFDEIEYSRREED